MTQNNVVDLVTGIPVEATDNVIVLDVLTSLDVPVERIVDEFPFEDMDSIVIMGFNKDGYFISSSSVSDGGAVLWMMELLKINLFNQDR